MAKNKAVLSVVLEGSNVFATLTDWTLNTEADEIDGTVIGSSVKAGDPGAVGYELECNGFFDDTDDGMSSANIAAGQEGVTISVRPRGTGSTLPQSLGVYNILSFNRSADRGGHVQFSLRAMSDGSAALDETAQV